MMSRHSVLKLIVATMVALLVLASVPIGAAAHLGDSGHIHYPGDSTTPTSAIWCVRFTQDPGAWRPEGETAVDPSLMEGTSVVFIDCDEVLGSHYTIESFADGSLSRETVGEPVIGSPDSSSETATDTDGDANYITVKAWTKHQKKWLKKGDQLSARLGKARTVQTAKRALGTFQRHLHSESQWLRKNRSRSEPESCLADDRAKWQKRVVQARKSLNKAVTAINHGNIAAANTNIRQFARAWTKVEQVYNIGMCDY